MAPEPDSTWRLGPLLIRRWARTVRVDAGRAWLTVWLVPGSVRPEVVWGRDDG